MPAPESGERAGPPEPRLAATILLLRDGAQGLEVFMVKRHHEIDFAKGAMVFPGGKVDRADADPALRAHARGVEALDDAGLTVRVAAIRETFEECGVLLARPRGTDALVDAGRLGELESRHREALEKDERGMLEVALSESLELACDLLVPFAHWVTPEMVRKRFDTHFYLVAAPPDHLAIHDGRESVDSIWTTPAQAMADADAGRCTIIFPTRMNLAKLGRHSATAAARAAAAAQPIVTVQPWVAKNAEGTPVLRIPVEAGYPLSEAPLDGLRA